MGLQERAFAALQQSQAEDEAERRRWFEDNKEMAIEPFTRLFGEEPQAILLGKRYSLLVEHDGLRFTYSRHNGGIHLLSTCPQCGEEAESPEVRDLIHLAELLSDFSRFRHECAIDTQVSDLRAALYALVDRIATEIERSQDTSGEQEHAPASLQLFSHRLQRVS